MSFQICEERAKVLLGENFESMTKQEQENVCGGIAFLPIVTWFLASAAVSGGFSAFIGLRDAVHLKHGKED
ncbi:MULTISPECIES: hypothetical protein [Caldicellulosiruptor]|uniref:Class IIb bacteriocin, lactobin A/cerein 7B family n=1 Tax=Caldicellulosiruptor morganii TaxID=1387555 RepID=A0ABY7BLK5_9FIRM|nr:MULTISPECIES: hypothetical protein [Caldicellulosiruptor]WAM32777.1 hypothetical protein OTK00_001222 [Caldicellulosiruptor morganii]